MERFRSLNPSRDAAGRPTGGRPTGGRPRLGGGDAAPRKAKTYRDDLLAHPAPLALALEPRMMFDAAGLATAVAADGGGEPAPDPQPADDGTPDGGGDSGGAASPDDGGDPALDDALAAHVPPADRTEIAFVDTAVEDWETLVAGLRGDIELHLLDGDGHPLDQMAAVLAGRSNVDAIHVISHGTAEGLQFGNASLSLSALDSFSEQLERIGSSLAEDGDILLYGCRIGEGDDFVDRFAALSGADVAASSDDTGSADLGGDWDLETQAGDIQAQSALVAGAGGFGGLLASIPADIFVSFDDQGFTNDQNLTGTLDIAVGGETIRFSYNNDNILFDGNDGQGGTGGLVLDNNNSSDQFTIETVSGNEFDFQGLYIGFDFGRVYTLEGFRDGGSVGSQNFTISGGAEAVTFNFHLRQRRPCGADGQCWVLHHPRQRRHRCRLRSQCQPDDRVSHRRRGLHGGRRRRRGRQRPDRRRRGSRQHHRRHRFDHRQLPVRRPARDHAEPRASARATIRAPAS